MSDSDTETEDIWEMPDETGGSSSYGDYESFSEYSRPEDSPNVEDVSFLADMRVIGSPRSMDERVRYQALVVASDPEEFEWEAAQLLEMLIEWRDRLD